MLGATKQPGKRNLHGRYTEASSDIGQSGRLQWSEYSHARKRFQQRHCCFTWMDDRCVGRTRQIPTSMARSTTSYFALFSVSKILPFIRRAISVAGNGFWHSDSGLSQKFEFGKISNRLRAAAPRQVSGSFT